MDLESCEYDSEFTSISDHDEINSSEGNNESGNPTNSRVENMELGFVQRCEKLKHQNQQLRQRCSNAKASLKSLRVRYKETRMALLQQLDINKQTAEKVKELEKETSQNEEKNRSVVEGTLKTLISGNTNSMVKEDKIDQLKRELDSWQTKYYHLRRDHETLQCNFDHSSKITSKHREAMELARKNETCAFREKVLSIIQSRCQRDRRDHTMYQQERISISEFQEANRTVQKLKNVEAYLKNELMNAANRSKQEECVRVDMENNIALERAENARTLVMYEKEVSSLTQTIKNQDHQIDRYKAELKDHLEKMSVLIKTNNSLESELQKLNLKVADSKTKHELVCDKLERESQAECTAFKVRVNELESMNEGLTEQMIELQQLCRKQKHDYLVSRQDATREMENLVIKYRNDNTTLHVQLANYADKLAVQDKLLKSEIIQLKSDCDMYRHDAMTWKSQYDLVHSALTNSMKSEENLKCSIVETEKKLLLVEEEKKDLLIKVKENELEISAMVDKCEMLDKAVDSLAYESMTLKERIKVLNMSYEHETIQLKENHIRLEEDFQSKVDCLNTKLNHEKKKSGAYKTKLLDAHRKNIEAKAVLSINSNRLLNS